MEMVAQVVVEGVTALLELQIPVAVEVRKVVAVAQA
jgi:hypothetical protein